METKGIYKPKFTLKIFNHVNSYAIMAYNTTL